MSGLNNNVSLLRRDEVICGILRQRSFTELKRCGNTALVLTTSSCKEDKMANPTLFDTNSTVNKAKKPIINREGQRFGLLVVKRRMPHQPKRNIRWLCVCDCGNEAVVFGHQLVTGGTRSCGCLVRQLWKTGNPHTRKYERATLNSLYYHHKKVGQQRWGSYLPRDTWESIVTQPCWYCGHIDARNHHRSPSKRKSDAPALTDEDVQRYTVQANGVDRVDPSVGYVPENCVSCCMECNWSKSDKTLAQFVEMCYRVTERFNRTGVRIK